MMFGRRPMRFIVAAIVCGVMSGCAERIAAPASPPAAPQTPDQKVLEFLDCYNPMYKLDADGRVIRLQLSWRHLPTPVMAEIGKLSELQGLDLASTTVTDDGLAQLKDLQHLRSLGVSGTQVTDKGLIHLEKLASLQDIWLPQKRISPQGKERLQNALPDLRIH